MNSILQLSDNDNFVSSIHFDNELIINIDKWNGTKCCIIGEDCCRLYINRDIGFDIGEMILKKGYEFDNVFEKDFASENNDYMDYEELILYDVWSDNQINLCAIAKHFKLVDANY